LVKPRILGVVSVEHDGRPARQNDGLCLTILVTLDGAAEVEIASDKQYQWLKVTSTDDISHLDDLAAAAVVLH